ncbi:MAG: hypothetical protein ACYDH5_15260 [Acidimicrobiales bacterium]
MLSTALRAAAAALRRRAWPVAASTLTVGLGLAYSFAWAPVVRHHPYWITPGDIWATWRSAQYVAWGAMADVYGAGTALVSLPGLPIALAPLALVASHLGLSGGFPYDIPYPTAWVLVGPASLAMSCLPLFALDSLAEKAGLGWGGRAGASLASGCALWSMTAMWGHPEDAVALGLGLYGLIDARLGRPVRAAWLLGAAMCFQPLAALLVPLALGTLAGRNAAGFLVRAALFPSVLVAIVLVADWPGASKALFGQPNYPATDWQTPWLSLFGHPAAGLHAPIDAGPSRLVVVAAAVAVGAVITLRSRRGQALSWTSLAWWAGAVLALRPVLEPVMVPYYVVPGVAVLVTAAACHKPVRIVPASIAGIGAVVLAFQRWPVDAWWAGLMALLAVTALVAAPVSLDPWSRRAVAPASPSKGRRSAELLGRPTRQRLPAR